MYRFWKVFGLDDGRDSLSFNKAITAVLTGTVVYAILHQLEVGVNILVLALGVLFGGFGLKGISLFATMYKRSDSVALTGNMADVVKAIRARRDDTHGIDPA